MAGGRLFQFVYSLCQWICYFFYLNVMWIACTLLGGVVLGIFPSTAALFSVARKTAVGEDNIPLFRTFWKSFRKEFWKVNGLGLSISLFGLLWYFNLNFFRAFDGAVFFTFNVVMTITGIIFVMMLFYIFPVYVHYNLTSLQYIKYSIALSFLNISNVLLMLITAVSAYYFFITFPGFIPLFGVSFFIQLNMWMSYQSFKKIDRKTLSVQGKAA
ncbi:putative membrane protein YesL [Salibacterium salarium]|uniref:YesL family protein n=1 Tax=Salibacterium salarium TaxID=284579 RepID=UPI0027892FEE|nr:YesL family protein [Salibacterium salarium]MDQ0300193.1 putative membrane protein YesL [Salibacterium salarium]